MMPTSKGKMITGFSCRSSRSQTWLSSVSIPRETTPPTRPGAARPGSAVVDGLLWGRRNVAATTRRHSTAKTIDTAAFAGSINRSRRACFRIDSAPTGRPGNPKGTRANSQNPERGARPEIVNDPPWQVPVASIALIGRQPIAFRTASPSVAGLSATTIPAAFMASIFDSASP
jgi:hypothetical protein